jgi:hypothetical protein
VNTERVTQVAHILGQHVAFKNEPFEPRPLTARVFRTPSRWFGTLKQLDPVAFRAHVHIIETMGCILSTGGMRPYLWLDSDGRLIGEELAKGKLVPVDVAALTDEDIVNLEIGIKGDSRLLHDEYERVNQEMVDSLHL